MPSWRSAPGRPAASRSGGGRLPHPARPGPPCLPAALAASVALVALLTLDPRGTGWSFGSPATEAHRYLTGLSDPATVVQLTGNLALLAAPAALLVARWPALGRPLLLAALGLSAGTSIELLQWALPLGRVVSPLDAVLNATGALAAGLLAARLLRSPGRHGRMALPT